MVAEGRINPDVRSWTMLRLKSKGAPKGPKARSKALLEAVREQSDWVPDPTDAEFMAGAHLTLGDGVKPPFFVMGDCDDLTIALMSSLIATGTYLAAAESVGTKAAIVGHAYGPDRMIEHVLGAIFDPNDNLWYYVDPSLKNMPFGECRPFVRERVYIVPSGELLCDDTVCLRPGGRAAGAPPMPRRGDFVAVNGTPGADREVYDLRWIDGVPEVDRLDGRPTATRDITGLLVATYAKPPTQQDITNEGIFNLWQEMEPCRDNPLQWCASPVSPPETDYAAQGLFEPWHDGLEPYSGADMLIPNSGFLKKR